MKIAIFALAMLGLASIIGADECMESDFMLINKPYLWRGRIAKLLGSKGKGFTVKHPNTGKLCSFREFKILEYKIKESGESGENYSAKFRTQAIAGWLSGPALHIRTYSIREVHLFTEEPGCKDVLIACESPKFAKQSYTRGGHGLSFRQFFDEDKNRWANDKYYGTKGKCVITTHHKGFTYKEIILPAADVNFDCGLEKVKNPVHHIVLRFGLDWFATLYNKDNINGKNSPLDVIKDIHIKIGEAVDIIQDNLRPRGLWFFVVEIGEIGGCIAAYANDRSHTVIQLNPKGKAPISNEMTKESRAYIFGRRISMV